MNSLYVLLTGRRLPRPALPPTPAQRRRRNAPRSGAVSSRSSSASGACRSPRSSAERLRSIEGHVRLEPVQAALAAEARLLVAAERARRIEPVERVRPDDAGAEPLGHPEDARALLRPDAGREPVRRVVRLLDRLLRRTEGEDGEHRAEDLLLGDPGALGDVREHGRREPVALLRQAARRLVHLGALLGAGRDKLADPVELHARVDRAEVGVLVQRVADTDRAQTALEL